MTNLTQIICANSIGVYLLTALIINIKRRFKTQDPSLKVFTVMLYINILQCIFETFTFAIDGQMFTGAILISRIINVILFFNTVTFAFLWTVYADLKSSDNQMVLKKSTVIKAIPALVNAVLAILNLFFDIYFTIDENNTYIRVGIYLVSYVIAYFYLVLGAIEAYGARKNTYKSIFLPAMLFLLPITLASVFQYVFYGISLLWVGSALGLNSAYVWLLDESSSIDTLSGTFTRHFLNQYLAKLPKHAGEGGKTTVGIMLDIDKFKAINDTHGHLVGDDAIGEVGGLLRAAVADNGKVFRYAGDEFTIIMKVDDQSEVDKLIHDILASTERFNSDMGKPYHLSFSVGCAVFEQGDSISDFLHRMDDAMYDDKKAKAEFFED